MNPVWFDCRRCPRFAHRIGVVAPTWSASVRVVVVGDVVSRAAQAVQSVDPSVASVVRRLRAALKVGDDECVGDSLVACGLSSRPLPDEVAACSRRFVENAERRSPDVIVLLPHAHKLAEDAGLLDDGQWFPLGARARIPVVISSNVHQVVQDVGTLLGKVPTMPPPPDRTELAAQASKLLAVIGGHRGKRVMKSAVDDWKTYKSPLKEVDLERHLHGLRWVSAHRPTGGWPYVVLDVDRHNAIQDIVFRKTLMNLKALFPKALFVRSSESEGVHVYVRLPGDVHYNTAARLMNAYLALKKVKWHEQKCAGRALRTELVEVPLHPPRLPFGAGSMLWRSKLPLEDQLETFIRFCGSRDFSDYTRARDEVAPVLRLHARWTAATRRRVDRWLLEQELGPLKKASRHNLPSTDPWSPYIGLLEPHLQHVAVTGVPALGTRTRWTLALISALADLVPKDEVREFMTLWIESRSHASADIETDVRRVMDELDADIERMYRRIGGVPVRLWTEIKGHLDATVRFYNKAPRVDLWAHAKAFAASTGGASHRRLSRRPHREIERVVSPAVVAPGAGRCLVAA